MSDPRALAPTDPGGRARQRALPRAARGPALSRLWPRWAWPAALGGAGFCFALAPLLKERVFFWDNAHQHFVQACSCIGPCAPATFRNGIAESMGLLGISALLAAAILGMRGARRAALITIALAFVGADLLVFRARGQYARTVPLEEIWTPR